MSILSTRIAVGCTALALGLAACAPEPEERNYWDIIVELTQAFETDAEATVSVAEAQISDEMAESLDTNEDGLVDRDEFWAYQEKRAQRPYSGPQDRSQMSGGREGGFPLNVDPEIVAASDVELGDDDMVMGVVIAGEARAYPVNYMNGPLNEVVNDTLGGAHIAPTW